MSAKVKNAMTVDVEDYFHVSAFAKTIDKNDWKTLKPTVEYNTKKILNLFAQHNVKATFFILGWVARAYPDLIRTIHNSGHEIASHGFEHTRITEQTRDEYIFDVSRSISTIEDIIGDKILGYRAPSFSINETTVWAYQVLAELGIKYSSSTYPICHDLYGEPSWPRFPHSRKEGILEIPISTIKKGNKNVGIGGGGYFRLYPYFFSKNRINSYHQHETHPYNFYFHPWEIDPNQPRISNAPLLSKIRHYTNLNRMENKLRLLIQDFNFSTMKDVYLTNSTFPIYPKQDVILGSCDG
ncbi:DUF3473 domain-containing protein [Thalassotalea nanhaiensis]|uniref:DUF3473 domain-containing protein n=1 Tax=Thalassotalea nanhaiensis TaxID=3065648 RepID=A0ABY9TJ84_9GAMM|nr:DUF3473 domain-containing protein [Colwelliaceae bacterium SQ345]